MKLKKQIIIAVVVLFLIVVGVFLSKASFTLSKMVVIKNITWEKIFGELPADMYRPIKDEDRVNILLLGIGGEEHPEGGFLADSIMIVSFKKSTGEAALISMPRDIYLEMPGQSKSEKINTVYVLGENKYGSGLDYSKKTLGYITGVFIDYAVAVDFKAFKSVIDTLGGVDIYLEEPFIEDRQWWCDENGLNCQPFVVESGQQTLDSKKALLYVRSRFSSSDFDRARRQQQIMSAIKEKAFSLNILANPLKINKLLDSLADNVKMDIKPSEFSSLIQLAQQLGEGEIVKKSFDISPEGLLQQTIEDDIYILLPVGNNFDKIRETCQTIFK